MGLVVTRHSAFYVLLQSGFAGPWRHHAFGSSFSSGLLNGFMHIGIFMYFATVVLAFAFAGLLGHCASPAHISGGTFFMLTSPRGSWRPERLRAHTILLALVLTIIIIVVIMAKGVYLYVSLHQHQLWLQWLCFCRIWRSTASS